jgi:ribonuclease BN (tRNA processing enzyme)
VLIHDAQYDDDEYTTRVGWGHSSISQLAAFAEMTEVKRVVTFHHDPSHTDDELDVLHERLDQMLVGANLVRGTAGLSVDV